MKKKAVIIALDTIVSEYLKENLDKLLGDLVDFDAYSLEAGIDGKVACDLCIFPTEDSSNLNLIAEKLLPGTKFLSVKRTLLIGEWQKIAVLPYGTKALLVNSSRKLAYEAISFLLEMGANHIEFFPFFPGAGSHPAEIRIAITPDETAFVPADIGSVINIGPRVIDSGTVFEIINALDLFSQDTKSRLLDYMALVMPKNLVLMNYFNQLAPESEFLREIVFASHYMVIACDDQNRIIYHTKPDRNMTGLNLYGHRIDEFFDHPMLRGTNDITNEILEFNGKNYLSNRLFITNKDHSRVAIYALIEFDEFESLVVRFHQSKRRNVNKARYVFSDIVGNSEAMVKVRNLALKAARTELDILIEAETGTGKELFAHAIHNASRRKSGPFIAFNCAAISGNLLESELFGYEEGAFTGARKGGKRGLIESANFGTLFLDEIGEIPSNTQINLLRVLQEREVIRVGGTDRIPVDIRVIAATNRNLSDLVEKGIFRKDLFYRLNILPIRIPPLRERKEDIILHISSILKNRNLKMDVSDEVIRFLSDYEWPGNVRELINCCEYVINMEDRFAIDTLPYYIRDRVAQVATVPKVPAPKERSIRERDRLEVLRTIDELHRKGEKSGRKRLSELLRSRGMMLTESEVRSLVGELDDEGLVEVCKGRSGTRISEKGRALLGSGG